MSATSGEQPELKGGHPPAVKAGGMRITQHKGRNNSDSEKVVEPPPRAEGDILKVSTSPPKALVLPTALAKDTHTPASFHERPVPTHDIKQVGSKPTVIQQPRK